MKLFIFACVFMLACVSDTSVADSVRSYFDGDFYNGTSTWARQAYRGSASIAVQGSNGNPGRNLYHDSMVQSAGSWWVHGYFKNNDALFDPATEGELLTVTMRIDHRWAAQGPAGSLGGIAVFQDGKTYISPHMTICNSSSWQTRDFATYSQDDFSLADSAGTHPDFSIAGTPIYFGLYAGQDGTGTRRSGYIDNWDLTITYDSAVPLPAAMWTCLPIMAWIMRQRAQR